MMYSKQMQIGKRKRPKQKDRTKIKAKDYNKAIEIWGDTCWCGNPRVEMHHVTFRSAGGKGVWTNLHPLCSQHHKLAHTDNDYRRHLEVQHKRRFGINYWMDEHDLYDKGLIEEPTREHLEKYFENVMIEKSR